MGPSYRRLAGALAVGVTVALAAGACGTGPLSKSAAPTAPKARPNAADAALVAKLPTALKAKGKLVVGVDATYAPNEFLGPDGQTVEGMDVDLFDAVARQLGLDVTWQPAPFDSIIDGVRSGKFDVGVSSFTVTSDREQQASMVSYFTAGTQWAVAKGNPKHVNLASACGLSIAVQKATTQADDIAARSRHCTDTGHAAIDIHSYSGQDQATASVVAGRNAAFLADSPIAAFAIKSTQGRLQALGSIYDAAPYGYVVSKQQTALAQAISGALKKLSANGGYKKALDRWGSGAGSISSFPVNAHVS